MFRSGFVRCWNALVIAIETIYIHPLGSISCARPFFSIHFQSFDPFFTSIVVVGAENITKFCLPPHCWRSSPYYKIINTLSRPLCCITSTFSNESWTYLMNTWNVDGNTKNEEVRRGKLFTTFVDGRNDDAFFLIL